MHIGLLTPEYPHPRSSPAAGIGTSIRNLATGMVEKGIQVSIFIYEQQENDIFMDEGLKIHLIKQQKFRLFGWYLYRKYLQNYLNKYIAVDHIDAVEVPDWTGISAFMKLRCPLVLRLHGSDTYFCHLENRVQKRKNFWFEKLAMQNADYLVAVSRFTAEKTAQLFDLKKEIRVIPNSVDVQNFAPNNKKTSLDSILYFGSVIRKKGVLELPEIFNLAIRENPEAQLIIAGKDVVDQKTGSSTRKLMEEKFTPEAIQKVVWLGELPYTQIREQIAKANVVVLPSFAEALPMTWIEAMAMEKPLITSNIGWAKEVMTDGKTGFTVDPKDHNGYAEKVLQLLKDPELATKMGKAARERVLEKFSSDVVVKQNIQFYNKLVRGKRLKDR
ncbi:glycosyltransferase family 4 protein [Salinimicrobium soli]|uniref:glycosyltransferase family 4 protein n=1 Tax=Salinimicrobium soli TaxID=1254399 RepID=UPI003AADB472